MTIGARLRGEAADETRAIDLLTRLGLAEALRLPPAKLSGGMRQRVALARTLYEDRPIVLMDEPFASLDALTRHRLQAEAVRALRGRTVLQVTHDPLEALRMADRLLLLRGQPPAAACASTHGSAATRSGRRGTDRGLSRSSDADGVGMSRLLRFFIVAAALLLGWEAVVLLTGVPPFILPPPHRIAAAFADRYDILARHAGITALEIGLGLVLGTLAGAGLALTLAASTRIRGWLMPLVVASQAIPVFAIAPLLVLWLGYGLPSKITMAALVIFFPVTVAFFDGLRRTDPNLVDLARTMNGGRRGAAWRTLVHLRLPAALPAFGAGLRVAAAVAPIGAVIGEWVGSAGGLGYLMLHANARMQVDLLFAALFVLAVMALGLYFAIDRLLARALPWAADTTVNRHS